MRTAVIQAKNWQQKLYKPTTHVSPNEALNGRKLKTIPPEVSPAPLARQDTLQETKKTMAERDAEQKSKIKAYADSKLESA